MISCDTFAHHISCDRSSIDIDLSSRSLYEVSTCCIGIFTGLTYWGRISVFVGSGLLSWLLMIPLYNLINAIGTIGGNTWKE